MKQRNCTARYGECALTRVQRWVWKRIWQAGKEIELSHGSSVSSAIAALQRGSSQLRTGPGNTRCPVWEGGCPDLSPFLPISFYLPPSLFLLLSLPPFLPPSLPSSLPSYLPPSSSPPFFLSQKLRGKAGLVFSKACKERMCLTQSKNGKQSTWESQQLWPHEEDRKKKHSI